MDKGLFVKDIQPDQPASGLFIIRKAETRKTRAGGIFWSLLLVDATGEIEGKIWKPELCGLATLPEEGCILDVESGSGSLFKNLRQFTIEKARLLTEVETEQLDQSWFRATSAKNAALMWEELSALCEQEFQEPSWHDFVFSVFEDFELTAAFCSCPGAISVHHAYLGGLLEHTLGVFTLCRQFADHYPELDRKVLLAGALFHDLGKIREYAYAVDISATDEGRLFGHLIMGVMLLEPFLQKAAIDESSKMQIKHLILSHHGELTYGACVQPMTQEAIALHFADHLDAKMAICRKQMSAHQGSGHWTEAVYALDGRRLYCPKSSAERRVESAREPSVRTPLAGQQIAEKSAEAPSVRAKSPQSFVQEPSEATSPLADSEQEVGKARGAVAERDPSPHTAKLREPKAAGPDHGLSQASEKKPAVSPGLTGDEEFDYEGFHFCESDAKANAPQEDLPTSLLAQWDEEDIARGQPDLGDLPDAYADDLRSQNVSKKAPRQEALPKPEAGQQKMESVARLPKTGRAAWKAKDESRGALQERAANAGQSGLESAGEALAARSSQASEVKVEEERRAPGSLSKEPSDTPAASETLARAFAADPELHFCDDDLLESFAQTEDLPDLAGLAKLKEEISAESKQDGDLRAEQSQPLAGDGKELDFSGTKSEDSKVSESPSAIQEPDRGAEMTDKPVQALDDKGVEEGSVSRQSPEQGLQEDLAAQEERQEKGKDYSPDGQASENATGKVAESGIWQQSEAPVASKSSVLPAWAQEPPKKKRATRKKNAAQAGISLLT